MRRALIASGVVLVTACTTSVPSTSSGPVPVTRGEASSFTPLVASSSAGARCVDSPDTAVDPGARVVAVRYSGPPQRQVTVMLDADGTPTRYLDVRGDFEARGPDTEDRTTIGLYLDQGYALLSNRAGQGDLTMLEVPVDDVLTSPRLGDPSGVIEEVLRRCSPGG